MKILLLHNHQSYEDFEISKVLVIPDSVAESYKDIVREFLLKNKKCYRTEYFREADSHTFYYYWFFNDEDAKQNQHILNPLNKPLEIRPDLVPEEAIRTDGIFNDKVFLEYLREHGIQILEPEYSI
jgi:hypothetical protein